MTIEELAFKDRRILANLNEKDLLDIIEFLQDDRKEWINQFSRTHNESIKIQEENQELKSQLKVPENCNLKTLEDYKSYYEDTTREQILEDSYIDYCAYVNLAHRYSKLEKQLENTEEELELVRCDLHNRTSERDGRKRELDECLSQQKEFIKYLEDEIERKRKNATCMFEYNDTVLPLKEVLQKYKSIIGVEDENKRN